jgi:hypothetical protein
MLHKLSISLTTTSTNDACRPNLHATFILRELVFVFCFILVCPAPRMLVRVVFPNAGYITGERGGGGDLCGAGVRMSISMVGGRRAGSRSGQGGCANEWFEVFFEAIEFERIGCRIFESL